MPGIIRKIAAALLICAILIHIPAPALAQGQGQAQRDISAGAMVFDLFLMRPAGIAATVVGSVFFIVALPFSKVGGNIMPAYEKMVLQPARFTFQRPLGDF